MAQSDELFQLIQSLSKAEKRYFKLFSNLGTGRAHHHTLALFDKLERLPSFDENLFLKSIKDPALRTNLPSSKTRLHEHLLRSLRLLHSQETIDAQLSALQHDIEILFEKQLVKAARKKLRKARALALHFEKEAQLLNLLHWEQRLFVLEPDEEEAVFYSRNEEEEKACIRRLELQRSLTRLSEQLRSLTRRGVKPRSSEGAEKFRLIISHPDLKTLPPAESFLCNALFLAIKGYYAFALGKFDNAWEHFHALLDLWHAHEDRISDLADFYLSSVNNYLTACLHSSAHSAAFLPAVKRLKSISGLSAATQFKFERVSYTQELSARINFGTYEEGVAFIKELSRWLDANEAQLQAPRLLLFYYNITLFYFLNSEFSTAQKWLRRILHFPATEARADIRDFARIFQLVLQYELDNLDVQEYLLRSAYRYLNRTQKLFDFEESLIHFMKSQQKTGGTAPAKTKKEFENLYAQWTAIQQKKEETPPVGLQVMLFWVESKLAGKSMKEYYATMVKSRKDK